MNRQFPFLRAVVAAILLACCVERALGQAPIAKPLDAQQFEQALDLYNQQKYAEAARLFETISNKFPTSVFIPEATFRLGYIQFLLGDYDKSVETLEKVSKLKNVTADQTESALALVPQVLTAKASKLKPDDPARRSSFEAAVRQFDVFLKQFPNSEEAESAFYYKALALYQIGNYEDAANTLKGSLQKFPTSPTILDSQYLLALTLGTLGNVRAQKATAKDPGVEANYDEADKLLNDIIIKRTDIALLNDADFQIAELAFSHSGFVKDKEGRKALLTKALHSYQSVASKELVLQAQQARIERFKALRIDAGKHQDMALFKRLQRVVEKEQEKLTTFQDRADQTLLAKLKMGQVFFQLGRYDEARVVLDFVKPFATDDDQKKQIAYFTAVSLAVQEFDPKRALNADAAKAANEKIGEKAVEAYNQFKAAYPKDEIAENLALLVGARFVDTDPEKAINYFKESVTDYPKGRFKMQALAQQASALVNLKRYDEALEIFKTTMAQSTDKEISAAAEFGIATVRRDTGKIDEAIKAFKNVRDKYPGTQEAERAAYFVGQVSFERNDAKTAAAELQNYVSKFPEGEFAAEAFFYLGLARLELGQKAEGLKTLTEVPTKYPQSQVAPFSFFERAKVANAAQDYKECTAIMRAFISAYPEDKALYDAYDFIAQIQIAQNKFDDAVATYREFAKARPGDPNAAKAILRVATIWKGLADKMPRFIVLKEDERAVWQKHLANSMAAAEDVIDRYPDSTQVALALANLLDCQKLRQQSKLITEADVEKYFQDLAKKYEGKASTRSKIIFTLASYTFEKDQKKAITQMADAYNEKLKYAPDDLDLYGEALIREKKYDDAWKIYEKLGRDYPVPKGTDPTKAAREVQDAQAMMLFGEGKILQEQNKSDEAKQKFDTLKQLYPWSPKMLEANYGIASSLFEKKDYQEALKLLIAVTRATQAPAELRAKSMLLLARVNEAEGESEAAINNYIKIEAVFGNGVPALSAEGLWRGAQLLEKEGAGQIPMPSIPAPGAKASPPKAPAAAKH